MGLNELVQAPFRTNGRVWSSTVLKHRPTARGLLHRACKSSPDGQLYG